MKKFILLFFILLIFSQLAFSQSEIFVEYSEEFPISSKKSKIIDMPRQSLILFKDSTFKISHGGCLQRTETGKWEINNDVLMLIFKDEYFDEEIRIRYLIHKDRLLALNPDNQVIKSDNILTQIKNKS